MRSKRRRKGIAKVKKRLSVSWVWNRTEMI